MSLVELLKDRFDDRFFPSTLHSRLFWETADRLSRSRWNRPQWKADRVFLSHFLKSTRDAYLKRGPVVWANLLFPSELIHGLGCIPFFPEIAAATAASAGFAPRFIDRAEEEGFSPDACSFHRCILGCAVDGFLPEPDLILTLSYPCDSSTLSFAHAALQYRSPHMIFDVPLSGRRGGIEILAEHLEEAAEKLAGLSGLSSREAQKGLEASLELSNRALYHLHQVEELRKRKGCPLDWKDAIGHVGILASAMGSEEGAEFYRLLAEELRERGSERDDSLRILWMHLTPYYPNRLHETLEMHGARIVCEEYTHAFWEAMDPGEPFLSLANKISGHFLVGPVERRFSHLLRLGQDYEVDGAIHFNHWGCRQSCGGAILLKQALQEAGIPTLILDGDCVDEREYQEGQLSTRLEAFLESLKPDGARR